MDIERTKPCPHCCDSDDDGCAEHIYRGHNCPWCKGTLRVPDDEPVEDYAVAAAQEWLTECHNLGRLHMSRCTQCKSDINVLAAIIRKHVEPLPGWQQLGELKALLPK